MMKYIKRLKSNAGMTLTEVLIGMFLLSLLALAVGALLIQVTRLQHGAIELAELNSLIDNVSTPVIRELANVSVEINFCDDDCDCDETCDPAVPDPAHTALCDCECEFWGNGENRFTMFIRGLGSVVYSIVDIGGVNDEAHVLFRNCGESSLCPIIDCDGHPVLQRDFYKNRTPSFELREVATGGGGVGYILSVEIRSEITGSTIIREYAVSPLALNQYG
jgi:prepilin-type N-terminal cleavage/methylation domain-containing protein